MSFIHCESYGLHIEMQNYKEEEEDIERLVRRLVDGVSEDVIMDDDQGKDSVNEQMMDVDIRQQATHMCGYSDVSSADTSPHTCHNTNGEIRVQNSP